GTRPARNTSILRASLSRQVTLWPTSAKQAPVTRPTYPEPIIDRSICGCPSEVAGILTEFYLCAINYCPAPPGSKLRSNPSFGNAFKVKVRSTPYSLTPLLLRTTAPKEAIQLERSR